MANSIDISSLKSNNTDDAPATNIDGGEVRDFGNGLKEFDPTANGFEPEPEPERKSDVERALEMCDDVIAEKQQQVVQYNELLDQYGGEITEEQLREEMGQGFITEALQDGKGGKYEDNPGDDKVVTGNPNSDEDLEDSIDDESAFAEQPTQSKELDELEQELEEDDFAEPIVEESKPEPKPEKKKPEPKPAVKSAANTIINMNNKSTDELSEEDKDLASLEDDNEVPVDDFTDKLKVELAKKMRPVSKKYDLSHAVITNKPVTVANMMSSTVPLNKRTFTWGLMRSKRPIVMKSFTATELNVLAANTNSRNNGARNADVIRTIWDHISGPGKGNDFYTWCKCTSFFDLNHIWFSIYGACYQGSNYLPFNCTECENLTVSDDIGVEDMCKFTKPEYKDELERIKQLPAEPEMGEVFAEYLSQITDTIVIGFKEPSIYDTIIVPTLLDSEFTQKYSDIINVNSYINNIYRVREVDGQVQLDPISLKVFPHNETKTLKARIIQFAKVIRALDSDQYNIILNYINKVSEEEPITYMLPATTCDHCHKELPEEPSIPSDLVFMRHRLAILGA